MNRTVEGIIRACILTHSTVRADIDSLGFIASKLWKVAQWTHGRI